MIRLLSLAALFAAFTLFAATPAAAVTSVTVAITDDGVPVPRSAVRIVNQETGAQVELGTGADGECGIVVNLEQGTYNVLIGEHPVTTFSVDGTGAKEVSSDTSGASKTVCKGRKRKRTVYRTRPDNGAGNRGDNESDSGSP